MLEYFYQELKFLTPVQRVQILKLVYETDTLMKVTMNSFRIRNCAAIFDLPEYREWLHSHPELMAKQLDELSFYAILKPRLVGVCTIHPRSF